MASDAKEYFVIIIFGIIGVIIAMSIVIFFPPCCESSYPSGFADMPPEKRNDKRCYVDNNILGTPFTFGSGFKGLIYTNDECDRLKGIYKYDPSYPNGKGRCYMHDKNFVDDDSYNIVCADTSIPPLVKEDERCFVNRIKYGYDKTDKNNNTLRLYNKKECDMLGGIYDKSTNICGIKGGNPKLETKKDAFTYLCGSGF